MRRIVFNSSWAVSAGQFDVFLQGLSSNTCAREVVVQYQSSLFFPQSLAEVLLVNKTIESIVFSSNAPSYHVSEAVALGEALKVNRSLKKLSFSECDSRDVKFSSLGECLAWNDCLSDLDLSHNTLSVDSLRALGEGLSRNMTLARLSLSQCQGLSRDKGLEILLKPIVTMPHVVGPIGLKHLNLSQCQLKGADGVEMLMQCMMQNRLALHTLDLNSNEIDADGMRYISDALLHNGVCLNRLDLAHNSMGESGLAYMGKALLENTSLTHLNLSGNFFGRTGSFFVFDALSRNPKCSLCVLHVNECDLREEGWEHLFEMITINRSLVELSATHCMYAMDNLLPKRVTMALESNMRLEKLNLSFNSLNCAIMCAMAQGLVENVSLRKLDLTENTCTHKCLDAFETVLSTSNRSVTELGLSSRDSYRAQKHCVHNLELRRLICGSVLALLNVRSYKRTLLNLYPKEIIRLVAQYLWQTKADSTSWNHGFMYRHSN